jgi:hypothetical protein
MKITIDAPTMKSPFRVASERGYKFCEFRDRGIIVTIRNGESILKAWERFEKVTKLKAVKKKLNIKPWEEPKDEKDNVVS